MADTVSRRAYIARETTPGTRKPPNIWPRGLNLRIQAQNTQGQVRPSGLIVATERPTIMKWSLFTIAENSYLDYRSVLYPLAGMLGLPVTSTPGGATNAREHLFTLDTAGLTARQAFSIASGYPGGTAEEALRCIWDSFSFGFTRNALPSISGGGYGRNSNLEATLGVNEVNEIDSQGADTDTFTITVAIDGGAGQTTTALDWDDTAGDVEDALEALSNVGPGDVVVTGGPGGTAPFVLTWGGALANKNITVTTTPTGGTAAVTTTQAGGITAIEIAAIAPPELDAYIDTAAGSLGTTKVDIKSADVAFTGLTTPDWRINSAFGSYKKDILQVPTLTCNVVTPNSDGSDGEFDSRQAYQDLLNQETLYIRLTATGPEIESGQSFLFQVDMAVKGGDNMAQLADMEGFETLPLPLVLVHDTTLGTALKVLVRNDLTAVA